MAERRIEMGETAAADLTAVGLAEHERRIRVAAIRVIAAAKISNVGMLSPASILSWPLYLRVGHAGAPTVHAAPRRSPWGRPSPFARGATS